MKTVQFAKAVNIPSEQEFIAKYPRYTSLVLGKGRRLFNLIMQPSSAILAMDAVVFGLPSVMGVAELCRQAADESTDLFLDPFTKQFIGAAVCSLMEANGYRKTGTKRSVPHESFTVGEYYSLA